MEGGWRRVRRPWIGGAIGATAAALLGSLVLVPLRLADWETIGALVLLIWGLAAGTRLFRSASTGAVESVLSAAAPLFERVGGAIAIEPDGDPLRLRPEDLGEISGLYRGRMATLALRRWPIRENEEWSSPDHLEFRIACDSLLRFTCKRWDISAGPPFTPVRMPARFRDQPLDFLTSDTNSFAFWRTRQDFRSAAEAIVSGGPVLFVSLTPGWLVAWWNKEPRESERLPGILAALARLAAIADGKT